MEGRRKGMCRGPIMPSVSTSPNTLAIRSVSIPVRSREGYHRPAHAAQSICLRGTHWEQPSAAPDHAHSRRSGQQ